MAPVDRSEKNRFWAVVPAAGSGSRMKSAIPKQYLAINGYSILEITLQKLAQINNVHAIVVALGADDKRYKTTKLPENCTVMTVKGGQERSDSVLNSLDFIRKSGGKDNDWILVHDAARPLAKISDIEHMISKLENSREGGLLAAEVVDTIKQADNNLTVTATVERSKIFRAFTPQMFRLGLLARALLQVKKNNVKITDDSEAMELAGIYPKLILSDPANIKITTANDLAYAKIIMDEHKTL